MKKLLLIFILIIGCATGRSQVNSPQDGVYRPQDDPRVIERINAQVEEQKRKDQQKQIAFNQSLLTWKGQSIYKFIKSNGRPKSVIDGNNGGKVYFYEYENEQFDYAKYGTELMNIELRREITIINIRYPKHIREDPYDLVPQVNFSYLVKSTLSLFTNKKGQIEDYSITTN